MNPWLTPETVPPLTHGGTQLWRVWLEHPGFSRQMKGGLLEKGYAALTGEERDRASRMRVGSAREEFVAGRGLLRLLLASVTGKDPHELDLTVGEHGKPELAGGGVAFNVAHSRGMVLIALSRSGSVGVDVEFVDASVELIDVARTAFHPADVARIAAAETQAARLAEFYRCWTWKEAIAKADGRGLTIPLAELEIGTEDTRALGRFFVQELDVGPEHVAAVASELEVAADELYEMQPGLLAGE